MWSKRFLGRFFCPEKSRKRPCCKGFRALAVPIVDRRKIAPKAGALPTALHPVIQFVYPAGRILPNHPLCQSRWFQIFVLVHYSTVFWRFKVFSVCNFIVVIQKNFQKVRKDKVSITRFTPKGNYVTVKCSGGLKVTRENERIPPYRT